MFKRELQPSQTSTSALEAASQKFEKRRARVVLPVLSALGVIGLTGASAFGGVGKAIERIEAASHKTITITGTAEMLGFDETYEPQCWTASTVGVSGGMKDEHKPLGVVVGSKETAVTAKEKNSICADLTQFNLVVDQKTKHTDIEMPEGTITYSSELVVGSARTVTNDIRGTYAAKEVTHIAAGGLPWVRDAALLKMLSEATNGQAVADDQYNMSLILAMHSGVEQCAATSWTLGQDAVEEGIENIYKRGLYLAKALHPEAGIDPENISVLVGGVPISKIEAVGSKSNLDESYNLIKGIADDPKYNFTMSSASENECVPSPDVQKKLDKKGSLAAKEEVQ